MLAQSVLSYDTPEVKAFLHKKNECTHSICFHISILFVDGSTSQRLEGFFYIPNFCFKELILSSERRRK